MVHLFLTLHAVYAHAQVLSCIYFNLCYLLRSQDQKCILIQNNIENLKKSNVNSNKNIDNISGAQLLQFEFNEKSK